ncbi:hypothetical protein [Streptomyces sp. NPDC006267]|uniref:hypothetical protein n=1 Tax=Streptomyces sp. NPDC006267 TaxID=3157173 RepID=UPI0033A37090
MSKPNRKVIRLQQMRAQIAQKAGVKHVDLIFEVPGDIEAEERICSFLTQDHWPLAVVKAVEAEGDSNNLGVLRKIATPPEAFDQLVEAAQLTVGELTELLKEISGEAGTDTGEDSGSSSSSKSTPEPSAPTSSGTTPAAA